MKRVRAKKSYGQHFLNDERMAQEIVNSLTDNLSTKNVLEVGPGKGVLTKYLLSKDINLRAIEADRDMVEYLGATYPSLKEKLILQDFLKSNLAVLFNGEAFGLIGNYPYNISSQILFKMVDHRKSVPLMVGMFQKEVADRVIAPHGSKTYGVISVLIQAYYEGEYLLTVPPSCFDPPPRVMSAVIKLTRKENLDLSCDPSLFKSIVKISFGQRRKMLRNTMKQFIKDPSLLKQDLFTQRPEQLSVEDFIALTKMVENQ